MKPIIAAPLVAVALAGAGVGAYIAVAGAGSGEEAPAAHPAATPMPSPAGRTSATPTPAPTPPPAETPTSADLASYDDVKFGFSADYPAVWSVSEAAIDPDLAALDVLKGIEFVGKGGLPRASIAVYQNPEDLTLEDWIMDHNPIFFDRPPVEMTIAGSRALLQTVDSEGLPKWGAYVKRGSLVFSVGGLTQPDFDAVVDGLRFDRQ